MINPALNNLFLALPSQIFLNDLFPHLDNESLGRLAPFSNRLEYLVCVERKYRKLQQGDSELRDVQALSVLLHEAVNLGCLRIVADLCEREADSRINR